jgi:hypothetical protein
MENNKDHIIIVIHEIRDILNVFEHQLSDEKMKSLTDNQKKHLIDNIRIRTELSFRTLNH